MADTRTYQKSFTGGELSPEMLGRLDDAKYADGLSLCLNFITTPQGPAINRPGFQYIGTVKNPAVKTRIIPFVFSSIQTRVIEMGAGYFRFWAYNTGVGYAQPLLTIPLGNYNAGTFYSPGDVVVQSANQYVCITATTGNAPTGAHTSNAWWYYLQTNQYEIPNGYAAADLMDIHYVESNDVITLVHPNYPPLTLNRSTNSAGEIWYAASPNYGNSLPVPSTPAYSVSWGGVTPPNTPANWSGATVSYSTGAVVTYNGNQYLCIAAIAANVSNPVPSVDPNHWTGQTNILQTYIPYSYVVTTVSNDQLQESTPSGILNINGSTPSTGANLLTTGCTITLSWTGTAGYYYNVYKLIGGLFGYIGQVYCVTSGTVALIDNNIAPDLTQTPPNYDGYAAFNASNQYPGAVGYFQQRKCFAGTLNLPQNIWMTKSGTESNMSFCLPVRDSDRVAFRVAARESQTIRHIVPLTQLILLTSSGEWKVSGASSETVTPSSVSVLPQSYIGSSNVQPVTINNSLIFAAARGGHLREMTYSWQMAGFVSEDMSLRAAHLFDNQTIVDMAYSKCPRPIVWCVSSSGKLLGMTYLPEQQIESWHQHSTLNGSFESCCVVPENQEDVLYVVVNRTINGNQTRYIERLATRYFTQLSAAFFVDCGATFTNGSPVTTLTGLTWLEGQTVAVLGDGLVQNNKTVIGGSITLDTAATVVTVGLPITAQLQTLPLSAQIDGAFGQGRMKNIRKVWARLYQTASVQIGPNFSNLSNVYAPTQTYGMPAQPITNTVPVVPQGTWTTEGQICVVQTLPLPLEVVGLTIEVSLGS